MKTCLLLLVTQLFCAAPLWSQSPTPKPIVESVLIVGDFSNPGPITYTTGMTLMDALQAGGDMPAFGGPLLYLIRCGRSEQIDLKHLRSHPSDAPRLQPWDILYCNPKFGP